MLRRSAFAKALWLLAIAVLVVRVGDAHLHFCADGQEQRMALHVSDTAGQHHGDEARSGHNDRDVDVSPPAFVKKVGGPDELHLAPVLAFVLLVLPVVRRLEPAPARVSNVFKPVFLLRPPLRGPPR
jgi:hypothetical protein